MAKRKITVTVDEDLLDLAQASTLPLSAVVNTALAEHLERSARHAALGALLTAWEAELGPIPEADLVAARSAFAGLTTAAEAATV